jgi:hypothetical protein
MDVGGFDMIYLDREVQFAKADNGDSGKAEVAWAGKVRRK